MELVFGILIGVITSAVIALALVGDQRSAELAGLIQKTLAEVVRHEERIAILEKRKALLADAVISQPKATGVAGQKLRTWNEDAAGRE